MRSRFVGFAVAAIASIALVPAASASAAVDGPQIVRTDNGGHRCDGTMRTLGEFASSLSAYATDPTAPDHSIVTYRFHLWPAADPAQDTVLTDETVLGSLGRASVPDGVLLSGASYVWRTRVSTASGVSPWSPPCSFTYDDTAPSGPTVTSANYLEGTWGPPGELAQFTFDGNGDPDVAGFIYSWNTIALPTCSDSGPHGTLVCPPPFDTPETVRARRPGGKALIALDPPDAGPQTLTVRSLDRVGNLSADSVTYRIWVSATDSNVTTLAPRTCDGTTTFSLTPNEHVDTVVSWNYRIDVGGPITQVQAAPDGTAQISVTTDPNTLVGVQSVSANGFTSSWTYPVAYLKPIVSGTPYVPGSPTGGPGQTGTFSLDAPFYTPVDAYRYLFVGGDPQVLPSDPATDGATFDWTPQAAGRETLVVRARTPDGQWSCATSYRFRVAGA